MAFGITKEELRRWKDEIESGKIAFLTHYWLDDRFPGCKTVTKVGCNDIEKLKKWGEKYKLKPEWIHKRKDGYSHFDLLGEKQVEILKKEGLHDHIW
ncbi:hypothetical protein C0966_05000 [Bacillus methanolicus]|uniref:hypothetical protein n=1 Tax=Bacillus methanolicus TaxID=1471 RepID=UPI002380B605|nr:hypothetical protein [Bacillus methanolicus]MDE3838737.1 hypothetical protein [Bacillus methanolicus]